MNIYFRHLALLAASLILGASLTALQGFVVPVSQTPAFDAPLPTAVAIGIVVVAFYGVWLLAQRLAGVRNGAVIIIAASTLLIFDKYLFGMRSLEHFTTGIVWIVVFWGGMAWVDVLTRPKASVDQAPDEPAPAGTAALR